METFFPSIEAYNAEKEKTEIDAVAPKEKNLFSSYKIQQLLLGFSPEEILLVKNVEGSYLLMLEAIALIRKHRKEW